MRQAQSYALSNTL